MVLLSGLLLPFASVQASAPSIRADLLAQASMLPAAPTPSAVVVVGDFQTAFGCGGWDVNCGATQLQRSSAGIWSAVLDVPAGNWVFRIVTRADIDRSLGEGGDANGQDIRFEAFDGTATFFSFNEFNGEIAVGPFLPGLTATDDSGNQYQVVPGPNGGQTVTIPVQGSTNVSIFADGAATDSRFVDVSQPGFIVVSVDSSGIIQDANVRISASLQVFKQDEGGNPVTGSCFAVVDGRTLLGQACDSSDGDDGFTTIRFPGGIRAGSYTLTEVRTPDGVDSAPDQNVDLFGGDFSAVMSISGGGGDDDGGGDEPPPATQADIPPTEPDTFNLTLYIVDQDYNPVAGGCYQVSGHGEQCDEDQDTVVIFGDLESGDFTVTTTQAPDGFTATDPLTISIGGEDAGYYVFVNPAVVQQFGTLYVNAVDADENLVPGACWQLRPRPNSTGERADACDGDDGSLDGVTIFSNAVAGSYAIDQTVTPDGYEPAGRRNVDVPANGEDSISIRTIPILVEVPTEEPTATTAPEEPTATTEPEAGSFSLSLYATDQSSNPLVGGCYALDGGSEVCDDDNDSVVIFSDLENGSYDVTTTSAPDGFGPNEPLTADINGEDAAFFVIHPAAAAEAGTLYVSAVDANDSLVPGACWQLRPRPNSTGELADACDGDDGALDGVTTFSNAVAGAYAIDQTQTPDGYEVAGRRNVDVPAGGENAISIRQPSSAPTATEEPQITAAPVIVSVLDADGNTVAGACVALAGDETFSACDNDVTDVDPSDGVIQFAEVPSGEYTASADSLPPGFDGADTAAVSVPEGNDEPVFAVLTAETARGSLSIETQSYAGDVLAGACYSVAGGAPVCDNGEGDASDADGVILIEDLAVGDYQVVQTEAPDGYDANTEPMTATVPAGDTAFIFFFNAATIPPFGDLEIVTVDEGGTLLAGACYSVDGGDPICDNGDRDSNPDGGTILIEGLDAPADYSVGQTTAPEGHDLAPDAQTASVPQADTASITFTNQLTPPPTGRAYIVTRDSVTGEELGGACYRLEGPETIEICDGDGADTDEDPGQLRIGSLLAGDYTVTEIATPAGYEPSAAQSLTVPVDEVGRVTFELAASVGSLRIAVASDGGEALADACVSLNGGEPICDNGDGDSESAAGEILIENLAPGIYTVASVIAPDGFELAGDQTVEIVAGEEASFDLTLPAVPTPEPTSTNTPEPEPTATATNTPEPEPTATATNTPEPTATSTPEPPTATPTEEPATPVPPTATPTEEPATPEPPTATPTEEVASPVPPTATPTEEPVVGAIEINVTSADSAEIEAGCFALTGPANAGPVCDGDANDESDVVGQVVLSELPEGDYTVAQTSAAEGFNPAGPSLANVVGDQTTVVEVANEAEPPATGSIVVTIQNQASELLGNACITVGGTETCDNFAGDNNPSTGVIELTDVTIGDYVVELSTPPAGYLPAEAQQSTVTADGVAEVTFTLEAAPVETGSMSIELQAPDGSVPDPAAACVMVAGGPDDEFFESLCDNEGLDQDPADGTILLEDLPVGVYSVGQAEPETPENVSLAEAQSLLPADATMKSVNVLPNTVVIVIVIIILVDQPGDLVVVKTDADSKLLAGACFTATSGATSTTICDNDENDGNSTQGIIRFEALPDGDYVVSESTTPDGFTPAPDQNVTMDGGAEVLTFVNQPLPNPTGTLVVQKIDGNDDPLPGACFALRHPVTSELIAGPICDAANGADADGAADGEITFTDVPAGTWTLVETKTPGPGWQPIGPQLVTITVDTTLTWPVVNSMIPGRVQITKRDNQGNSLPGACFLLELQGGDFDTEVCDNQAGDANATPGVIRIINLPPGEYLLTETQPPDGFVAGDPQTILVDANTTTFLTIQNQPYVPPTQTGTLVVNKVGPNGQPLAGACFALYNGKTLLVPSTCDSTDGANDGTIRFTNAPVGTWTLVETVRPSADFQPAPNRNVTINLNQTTTVTVENVYRLGRVMVRKTNQQGQPLQGACFDLAPDGKGPQCTNADGVVTFQDLQPGSYTLRETVTPPGYQTGPDRTGIVVKPGLTTTLNVVNKLAPPPPNAGSLKLIKFFCVSGTGQNYLKFIDSSDPGSGNPLQKAAGCTPGDATFIIRPVDGGINWTVNTGADGELRLLMAPGRYIIREQNGTLEEEFRIFTGQQTTLVGLNFRVPPKPAPGKIVVYKYTCDPGYEGTWYYDFANNCLEPNQLTNGVTFRVQGAAAQAQVTGTNGVKGQAVFSNLPPGNYTLAEDAPAGAQSVYLFCGPTLDSATIRAVNAPLALSIKAGETWYCGAFNVQDDVSDSRGSIQIEKWECAGQNLPANYDYERNCRRLTTGTAKFSLSFWDGTKYVPRGTGETNADGVLRFSQLVPGTYQLKEIGSTWCHAESDDVNGKGDLIVRAGTRTTVWIYNCNPVKQGPNTGVGSTAGAIVSGPASMGGSLALFALGAPLLALAGGLMLRDRKRRAA
ncbi:MAG: hypothetical protein IT334_00185 [Thermomicrobiales bacterium]|nr:hypothetical protein [Thermomicrobiales bacterium]